MFVLYKSFADLFLAFGRAGECRSSFSGHGRRGCLCVCVDIFYIEIGNQSAAHNNDNETVAAR